MIEEERYFSCGFGIGVYRRRDHYHLFLMFPEWSKSTVFQTVNKNHLHAEHALFDRTDFKSVTSSNLPALAGSGLVYIGIWLLDLFKLFRAGVLFI